MTIASGDENYRELLVESLDTAVQNSPAVYSRRVPSPTNGFHESESVSRLFVSIGLP